MRTSFKDRSECIDYLASILGNGYDAQAIADETGAWSHDFVVRNGRRFSTGYDLTASDEEFAIVCRRNSVVANELNFFVSTKADFAKCDKPAREPDYVSGSGSAYWYTEDGVIRMSDHWGAGVASCDWYLDGEAYGYGMHLNGTREHDTICAFCAWEGFERI